MIVLRYYSDLLVKHLPQLYCFVWGDQRDSSSSRTICAQQKVRCVLPFTPFDPVDLLLDL